MRTNPRISQVRTVLRLTVRRPKSSAAAGSGPLVQPRIADRTWQNLLTENVTVHVQVARRPRLAGVKQAPHRRRRRRGAVVSPESSPARGEGLLHSHSRTAVTISHRRSVSSRPRSRWPDGDADVADEDDPRPAVDHDRSEEMVARQSTPGHGVRAGGEGVRPRDHLTYLIAVGRRGGAPARAPVLHRPRSDAPPQAPSHRFEAPLGLARGR